MADKPSIPKGTRDFSSTEMVRRNYIFDTVRRIFQVYGYLPIETPAMENLSTLLGKYGEEGDKLLFKILNSGDFLEKVQNSNLKTQNAKEIAPLIADKGLRYDLTVPFARFVVQHQNEISFPFKRYQIQPVWRADRPQKGRYREFFQCDVDVIGSDSLIYEAELIQIITTVFRKLEMDISIKVNNRKILAGIADVIGEPEKLTDFTVSLDKIEKIGLDHTLAELKEKGFSEKSLELAMPFMILSTGKSFNQIYPFYLEKFSGSPFGLKGLEEIKTLFGYLQNLHLPVQTELDISLARGLNYYTGTIIEVKAKGSSIGSVCGGGRYDDLTGIFGLPDVSGVGISFGADRIYDVLTEQQKFPDGLESTTRVLFANFGPMEEKISMTYLAAFREKGIPSEIYPESAKLKKQLDYANRKNIPYVVLIGKDEIESGMFTVKDMRTGEQKSIKAEELIKNLI